MMFWRDNTAGKAFITYIMMVMLCGVMMVQAPRAAFAYFAAVQTVGLFVLWLILRR